MACPISEHFCDPADGAPVIVVIDLEAGTSSYYTTAGTAWAGDPATLGPCQDTCSDLNGFPAVGVEAADGDFLIGVNAAGDCVRFEPAPATTFNKVDSEGVVAPYDLAADCVPEYAFQKIVDHHGHELVADSKAEPLNLHRTLGVGVDTHLPGGELGVLHSDSDDAGITDVTNHHQRAVSTSSTSDATGVRSHVIASRDTDATGAESAGIASVRSIASGNNTSSVISAIDSTATGTSAVALAAGRSTATGTFSVVIAGEVCTASGQNSMAQGLRSSATAKESVAFGEDQLASGQNSFAAYGRLSTSSGNDSFAGGFSSTASGAQSHCTGCNSEASGIHAFAHAVEGSLAAGDGSTVFGRRNTVQAGSLRSFIAGGIDNVCLAVGGDDFVGGQGSVTSGSQAFAYGFQNTASGDDSFVGNARGLAADSNSVSFSNGQATVGELGTFAHGNGTLTPGVFRAATHVGFRGAPPQPARTLVTLADVILALQEQGLGN